MNRPLVDDEIRPEYARMIRNLFGSKARELGWNSKPDDTEDTTLLRKRLLVFVVQKGEDRQLASQAYDLALTWLKDRKAVEPEMVLPVLKSAAAFGDKKLLDLFYAEAKKTKDPTERQNILYAMGDFKDPAVAASALNLVLSPDLDIRESIYIPLSLSGDPQKADLVYEFTKKNFDTLMARLPRTDGAYLSEVAGSYCDKSHEKDADSFFRKRMEKIPGGPRILDQTLEEVQLCAALRKAQQSNLIEYLKSQPPN
jgi:alanyl aminopeptidase